MCWCLVWAGEPEAGEWDEQSGGRSQVSSAAGDGSGDVIWARETKSAVPEDGVRVCAFLLQANRGEGGGNFSITGDLCWESPATGETTAFIFAHPVSLNMWLFVTNNCFAVLPGSRDRRYSSAGGWCYRKCQRREWGHTRGNLLHTSMTILQLRFFKHSCFFFHHKAIKNNAGFRVWILFFLVMCSFSLLFLDWYDS